MKVLIIGGGIGGLTAALCAHHHGHDVKLFEKTREFRDIGAGIQIPPNAMKVLKALGLEAEIAKFAFQPHSIEARMGQSGRSIFTIPMAQQSEKRWGAPYLHIHRADYIHVLQTALTQRVPEAIIYGSKAVSYRQDLNSITLRLADMREATGDVLIGADGIKSVMGAQMLSLDKSGFTELIFTGNVAWRVVVPIASLGEHAPNPTACVWMGKGRHGVTYRLRCGELANFVGVVEQKTWPQSDEASDSWTQRGDHEMALEDFKDWHPVITTIIKSAAPDALYRWGLFDRKPLQRWVDGRAALLGDAAHPMLPFFAQGAAMAVEDSWVLAQELSHKSRRVNLSLKAYKDKRMDRCSKVQAASRANMKTFHQRTRFGQLKTYGPMWLAGQIAPAIVHRRMNWLYGYDVTRQD